MATILIVDDRLANREYLVDLLADLGHRLLEAADGAEALNCIHVEPPDLIITDILMPTMGGYEFVHHLRADAALANIPVIFCTAAYQEPHARKVAQACGVKYLIAKPADPQTILATVQLALQTRDQVQTPVATPARELDQMQQHLERQKAWVHQKEEIIQRLRATAELGLKLAATQDAMQMAEIYGREARHILNAKYAAIGLLGDDLRRMRHYTIKGVDSATAASISPLNLNAPVLRQILDTRHPVRLSDLQAPSAGTGFSPPHPCQGSFLGMSVTFAGQTHGLIYFIDKVGAREFSEEDEQIAALMAAQLGTAYQRLLQLRKVQQHAGDLELELSKRKGDVTKCQQVQEQIREDSRRWQALAQQLTATHEVDRGELARSLVDAIGQTINGLNRILENSDDQTPEAAQSSR